MERCDFSSVMTIIKRYISEDNGLNQIDFLYELFASFLNDKEMQDFYFDNGLVSKWMSGQARVSPRISIYYRKPQHKMLLMQDIEEHILPMMYDSGMAEQELAELVSLDSSISEREKKSLLRNYPSKIITDEAMHITGILCFAMERNFVKRDAKVQKLLVAGNLSPMLQDYVLDSNIPKPCRTFCGREQELISLHEQLNKQSKVFLFGIAGIGKSELAKAYAWQHRKEYTNILHMIYPGDLKQMITEMEFADDQPDDDDTERFRKHNRFLRSLKDDTLLIIDNFNTTATKDGLLSVVLKYRCRIIFTTRSRFEQGTALEVTEIADKGILLALVAKFYSKAEQQSALVEQIIDTVHSHTLGVELASRLLENGILEPQALLAKLQAEHAALSTDTIGIQKDGQNHKATYYGHIHTLFSLYTLSDEKQSIMRCLTLIPFTGIRARLFAMWLGLHNMDAINELAEMGFIQMHSGNLTLHPMVQEISITDTKPSMQNCRSMIDSLQAICLLHGNDISYHRVLFQTVENIIQVVSKDDTEAYLLFLENVFPYMEKYMYQSGMDAVLAEITQLLKDNSVGTLKDRALLLDFKAIEEERVHHNINKAIQLEKDALALLAEITADNAHLAANLHANLGGLYKHMMKYDFAKQHMEQGMSLLEQYGLTYTNDTVIQSVNYAVLLGDIGNPEQGIQALQKCASIVKRYNSDRCLDYAVVQESTGYLYLMAGQIKLSEKHFDLALSIYRQFYADEPELIEAKETEITNFFAMSGIGMAKSLLGRE